MSAQPYGDVLGIGDRLNRVCLAVADGLEMSGAVVTLKADPDGSEAVAAAVDQDCRSVAELEFGLGEGPARDAFRFGRPVLVSDLADPRHVPWLGFGPAAVKAGWRAVFAFPLHLGAARFGVLTMLDRHPQDVDGARMARCLAMAATTTEMLLQSSDSTVNDELDPQLLSRLEFRGEIYQAQGMVMEALGTDLADALARMRAHAFASERDLLDVSLDIVRGRLVLTDEMPHS